MKDRGVKRGNNAYKVYKFLEEKREKKTKAIKGNSSQKFDFVIWQFLRHELKLKGTCLLLWLDAQSKSWTVGILDVSVISFTLDLTRTTETEL